MESTLRLSADELRRHYSERELSPVDVIEAVAAGIDRVQPALNLFMALCIERAREEARAAERRFATGTPRPLEGIPIAVKDLLDTAGVSTTYGSAIFASHVPEADAVAVRRAREAGAIVVGKTATHEFAWGITCDNPHYGPCRNPWDPDRIPGGSSGGSAAALAASVVPLALGSDTGGSIRIPAAFCGVIGLKPTYDRVDVAGTFPLAPSLDHVGPMARRPGDARLLYRVLTGSHRDIASNEREAGLAKLRLGVCRDLHEVELADDVERVLLEMAAIAKDLGAEVVESELPAGELMRRTFATVQRAEALDTHRRRNLFPQRSAEYGSDVRSRLERAQEIDPHDYLGAAADRARIAARLAAVFDQVDLLLTPVSAASPVRVGETTIVHGGKQVDFRTVVLGATTPQNLAGLPSCALRGGFGRDGMPIGLQLTGPQGAEELVLAAVGSLFEATPATQDRRPDVSG